MTPELGEISMEMPIIVVVVFYLNKDNGLMFFFFSPKEHELTTSCDLLAKSNNC